MQLGHSCKNKHSIKITPSPPNNNTTTTKQQQDWQEPQTHTQKATGHDTCIPVSFSSHPSLAVCPKLHIWLRPKLHIVLCYYRCCCCHCCCCCGCCFRCCGSCCLLLFTVQSWLLLILFHGWSCFELQCIHGQACAFVRELFLVWEQPPFIDLQERISCCACY